MTVHWQSRLGVAAVAASAVVLAACDDGPTSPTTIPGPSFSGGSLSGPHVTVCVDGASPAGTYTFDRSADTDFGTFFVASPFTLGPGNCVDVWQDDEETTPADPSTDVTVTETGVPSGALLDNITVGGNPQASSVSPPSATASVNAFHGAIITYFHSQEPPTGGEGCTPGYWKQEQHFDSWPVALSTTFLSVFSSSTLAGDLTLLEALQLKGGQLNALARHAAAAYLNASSGDVEYGFTTGEVVDMVNAAFDGSADVEETKDALDEANNAGCPLN